MQKSGKKPIKTAAESLAESQVDHVGLHLWRAQKAFFAEMRRRLADIGYSDLTSANATLLPHIDFDGTRLTTLADRSGLTKQFVGQSIKELCESGYVALSPDPLDGRAKIVTFTKKGIGFIKHGRVVKQAMQRELTAHLGTRNMSSLERDLSRMSSYFADGDE